MSEDFSKKIKRYTQVAGLLSGMGARIAGEKYLGIPINHDKYADDLRSFFGTLKGPLMKIAQIMAHVPNMLPPTYAQELRELQSNAPSMGELFVQRRMRGELGKDWQPQFSSFDLTAFAAASLGQVHHATLLDGTDVVCKLQYPDMGAAVHADLQQLKLFLSIYQKTSHALSTDDMVQEITDRLYEELDYLKEAKNMRMYRLIFQDNDYIHVPYSYPEQTTQRLLTMEKIEGASLLDYKDAPLEERNLLAKRLFQAWYIPLYQYGTIHGDPHLGNYSATVNHHINLLDFGCVRVFSPSFIQGVVELYQALKENDDARAVGAYEIWGFTNMSKELLEALNLWASFLYTPLLDDRVRPLQEDHSGLHGKEIAGEVHQRLAAIGGVKPPREFVFMDRAAVGIGSTFMHLRAEINWHQLFESLIDGFSVDQVTQRQEKLLNSLS